MLFRAHDVAISFGGVRAVDGVSLTVEPGQILGLIGPNGAGKTTLLDCLSGFLPSRGRIFLGEQELTDLPPHTRAAAGLARSFQDARLFDMLTVLQTLEIAANSTTDPGILELLDAMGLHAYRDKFIRELSTGTRRIVDLAALLLRRPRVLLLDEPSSGIAQREAEALGPLLREIRERTGCAMIVIEHDVPLLRSIADRLMALESGRVICEGDPDVVVHDPEVVRAYLGDDVAAINRSGSVKP